MSRALLTYQGAEDLVVTVSATGQRLRTGESIELVEGRDVHIGRAASSDLVCDSPEVSRQHMVIRLAAGQLAIRTGRYANNGFAIDGVVLSEGTGRSFSLPAESPSGDARRFAFALVES